MTMNKKVLRLLIPLLGLLTFAVRAEDQSEFHFWFQRDGGCVACARMPPPGKEGAFPQEAGVDVMFNGFYPQTGLHWRNQKVLSYLVTYTYKLSGVTHTATQTAEGSAASAVIKPYPVSDLNNAQIVSISVAATYVSGTITKTANAPEAFHLY